MNDIRRKQKIWLSISFFITILAIVGCVLIGISRMSFETKIMLIALSLLILAAVLYMVIKPRITIYNMQYSYSKLLQNADQSLTKSKQLFTQSWYDDLEKNGYQKTKNYGGFFLMYKLNSSFMKKFVSKNSGIEILVIINDKELEFKSKKIVDAIGNLEKNFLKKTRLFKYVILQFKNVDEFSNKYIKEANDVSFEKMGRTQFTVINVCYSDNKIYFLEGSYYPTYFYKYATDLIKEIT